MKYYKLTSSKNIKEVGAKPQSEECLIGDIQKDFIPWEGIIDFDFKLPEPILEEKSKQTSYLKVIAISIRFLVIDNNLLTFLEDYNIGNYQKWKIKTWQNKQLIEKYNLFILNDSKHQYIDFKKSKFLIGKLGDWRDKSTRKPISINDHKEYLSEREKLRKDKSMILHDKIIFDLREANEDMFRVVNAPLGGYYVSERLKSAIEENGFTGMEFKEVSMLDKVEVIY
jgi:hypothetical protein